MIIETVEIDDLLWYKLTPSERARLRAEIHMSIKRRLDRWWPAYLKYESARRSGAISGPPAKWPK